MAQLTGRYVNTVGPALGGVVHDFILNYIDLFKVRKRIHRNWNPRTNYSIRLYGDDVHAEIYERWLKIKLDTCTTMNQ